MPTKRKAKPPAAATKRSIGDGLYQLLGGPSGGSWFFRYQIAGKRREMGLGTCMAVSLPEAKAEAARLKLLVLRGVDPIEQRNAQRDHATALAQAKTAAGVTFDAVAADYIESHASGWKSAKHQYQWRATLATYVSPVIGSKPVGEITTSDVLAILQPLWATKPETATRVRGRIELVLDAAKARNLRSGENPALWRGNLSALLPKRSRVRQVRHHPALPASRVQQFWHALKQVPGFGSLALQFAILTAARSGEVRFSTWAEMDLKAAVWRIPAQRMKAGREHRVPLSPAAVAMLKAMPHGKPGDYVFPGQGGPRTTMSDMTLAAVIRRMNEGNPEPWVDTNGQPVVPHGFRSTFRDWASELTSYAGEVAEAALAHVVGNAVEAAYRRGDLFDRRRLMMNDWADYLLAGDLV